MYARRFGIQEEKIHKIFLSSEFLDQLDACKDDASRRLLLGISEKEPAQPAE
jgi:hypothetical protein